MMQYSAIFKTRPNNTVKIEQHIFLAVKYPQEIILEASQTVSSSKGSTDVSLQINSTELHKNSETKTLDVPAQLVEGRTLVPVRAIAEAYDCTVGWDSETKTVSVKY